MQKIKRIDTYQYAAPEGRSYLLVRLESDGGIVGAGEATWFGHNEEVKTMIDTVIAPALIGQDLSCSNYIEDRFYPKNEPGQMALRHAISGVEIAAWDALGKMLGLPVYKLLGGKALPDFLEIGTADRETAGAVRVEIPSGVYCDDMYAPIYNACQTAKKPLVVDFVGDISEKNTFQLLHNLEKLEPWYVVGMLSDGNRDSWERISAQARVPLAARFSSRYEASPFTETAPMSIVEAEVLESGGIGSLKWLGSYLETYYIHLTTKCTAGAVAAAAGAHVLHSCPNALGAGAPVWDFPELLKEPFRLQPTDAPGLGLEVCWECL